MKQEVGKWERNRWGIGSWVSGGGEVVVRLNAGGEEKVDFPSALQKPATANHHQPTSPTPRQNLVPRPPMDLFMVSRTASKAEPLLLLESTTP
jgi:hypothetical protein